MDRALQNDVVLATVLKWLDFESLKEARQVSRHWNAFTNPELHRRLGLLYFDHDKGNIKILYKQQQKIHFRDLSVNAPVSLHIRSTGLEVWKILKDLGKYESWKGRITCLQLRDFMTPDLNRLLPFLLCNLQSLQFLYLVAVNNVIVPEKSVISCDFEFPEIASDVTFSVKTFHVSFYAYMGVPLDPNILLKCTSLCELIIEVKNSTLCIEFLEDLANVNAGGRLLPSCRMVQFQIQLEETDMKIAPLLLEKIACVANRIQAKHLNLSQSTCLSLPSIFAVIRYSPESLIVDVPASEASTCYTNWLMQNIRKFKNFAGLKELGLKPAETGETGPEPAYVEGPNKHNFETVKSLKIIFDRRADVENDKYQRLLIDSSLFLKNISGVSLCGLRLNKLFEGDTEFQSMRFLGGLQGFAGLRILRLEMEDSLGDLFKVGKDAVKGERKGLLEPLSLLPDLSVKTIEIYCTVRYYMSMDSVLYALFVGYEPRLKLNIKVKAKNDCMKKKYTVEEFKEAMAQANPNFDEVDVEEYW